MRILVALSGGIDSSVVAHLLKEQGHDLTAVRFTLWSDPLAPALAQILPSKCCNAQTAARAKKVAEDLNIRYHILNLEEEFKREVVDPFLQGYAEGKTPNPCIRCNRTIKFGRLLDFMEELQCEKLATGHYARVCKKMKRNEQSHHLFTAIDQSKDQSYYLYGLSQEQLSKVLFPLGDMYKNDVYELAKKFGVPYDDKSYRESQDLCFFPEKTPQEFLKRHLHLKKGNIVDRDGTVLGEHKGLPLYTLGQRRGVGVGGMKIPLEVTEKRMDTNQLVIEKQGKTMIDSLHLQGLNWISEKPDENREIPLQACLRSLSHYVTGNLIVKGDTGTFSFDQPQGLQAPGQHCVFYRDDEVLGGGIIQ
ncbi:tRNA 2-thiouridine(34) synthase MnmA [Candidatus Peribacteria bacterium RIFCSPHIGHO2_02_FULL_49_16]|nr:MAG: tRNA 2-thiouridine(34) synthase MnmA [Candidatus Peribacteria bacterium RIFCSPHIGHO2_01_FULL_49_38]OGJ59199.1 MAG: tRNA 2-thiouridine(34) synthase MnmA [Candidatus Peribacteria bacterium RIFCSPHIGHO2_02_FULL_49_16]